MNIFRVLSTSLFSFLIFASPIFANNFSKMEHPTLPYEITIKLDDENYNLQVINKISKKKVYEHNGVIPSLFSNIGPHKFKYDLNFDGHKELFLENNNPKHHDEFDVFIFSPDGIKKLQLSFSEISFDKKNKTFTCVIYYGEGSGKVITYKYAKYELHIINEESLRNKSQ